MAIHVAGWLHAWNQSAQNTKTQAQRRAGTGAASIGACVTSLTL